MADPLVLTPSPEDETIALMGARVLPDINLSTGFENNYVLGVVYQRFVIEAGDARAGVELGGAWRFGEGDSGELWGGIVARYDFNLFDTIRISPSMTFGLSAVTGPMPGGELKHVVMRQGDPHLLFYLGPEVSFSLIDVPQAEAFVRLHHRSGAWGTLGGMHAGQDAVAGGFRYHF